jgi:hypothetical protein
MSAPTTPPSPLAPIDCAPTFAGKFGDLIPRLDEAQFGQRSQIIGTDGRQFYSLGLDVAQRPAETDRRVKIQFGKY